MQSAAGYGAAAGLPLQYDPSQAKPSPQRRRLWNGSALWASVLLPWALFVAVFAVMSFSQQYSNPWFDSGRLSIAVNGVVLTVVLVFGWLALAAWQQKGMSRGSPEPTWHTFLFGTVVLAWLLALALGGYNFEMNVTVFNQVNSLHSYKDVDPSRVDGQRMMDAGTIQFATGTRLDVSKSMGFRNSAIYCVAPIIIGDMPPATYDFWAVGTGCCSEHSADFACGEYDNTNARSGLRLISDKEYYALAVQQAEATYGVKASNPVFLTWMQDPDVEVNQYWTDALRFFWLVAGLYGIFQAALVAAMLTVLSKLGW